MQLNRWILLLLLPLSLQAGASSHDSPKLFIGGGGGIGGLYKEFLQMAGPDPRLVVIPSGHENPDLSAFEKKWKDRGFEKVIVLHAENRAEALQSKFAEPIRFANAVWFSGGVQQRHADRYAGSPVEEELIKLLDRGGVIGGSSAGASIQTKAMICGGTEHPRVLEGLDLLQGAIVDQHFLKRNRLPRLVDAIRNNPKLIGYGIDEGTALVVQNGKMRVAGRSYVLRIKMVDNTLQIDAFNAGAELPLPKDEKRYFAF